MSSLALLRRAALFGALFLALGAQAAPTSSPTANPAPFVAQASKAAAPVKTVVVPTTQPSALQAQGEVSQVRFARTDEGGGLLNLKFKGTTPTVDLRQDSRRITLDLGTTPMSKVLPAALSVGSQNTPVRYITPVTGGPSNQIVIDVDRDVDVRAYQAGENYVVEVNGKSLPIAAAPALAFPTAATPQANTPQAATLVKAAPKGRPITFNFQDVPVRTVLQLVAEESGLNIVAADTVTGNVTLRLINVPWDQALDLVLQSKGLDQRRDGKVIWVAPQSELAKFEQDKEDARIALDNRADLQTDYIQINYHSAGAIFKALTEAKGIGGGGAGGADKESENSFLSPRGKLVADERSNTLMVSDIPKKIQQLRELIAVIDRPIDQVLIEGRIVIANDTFARDLGARFGVSGTRTGNNTGYLGNNLENTNSGNTTRGPNVNLPASGFITNPAASLAYTLLGANFSLDLELSALQEEGRGEVISNPRLITANQREGVIRQGKEVGYVTVTGSGNGGAATPNVQFKEALLELKVTPTITSDNRVFLTLNVKKDEIESFIDLGVYGAVPQFNKREINTAVLVEDGQTVVIGGVYEFTDRESVSKVPFLGDVPFLGNLFKKKGKQKQKAELLVFITPKIMRVAPAANLNLAPAASVALPGR